MSQPFNLSRSAINALELFEQPVCVYSVDSLRILSANTATQEWVGHDAQALQTTIIADLRPEADRARSVDQVHQFDGKRADAGTWTIVARSGDHCTASFTSRKVTFDGAEAVVPSIRDVTQIAQAEARAETLPQENETLRQRASLSAEHLASLFDGPPGKLIFLTPGEHRIVAVSDNYAESVMLDRGTPPSERLLALFSDDPAEPQADGASFRPIDRCRG